jgi:hypothetical protein
MPVIDHIVIAGIQNLNLCGTLNAIIMDSNVSAFILCGDVNCKFDSVR